MSDKVCYSRVAQTHDQIPVIELDKSVDDLVRRYNVKAVVATDLTIDEVGVLINWCSFQDSSLWEDMSLQEILNVYRATIEWDTFEDWADVDQEAAYAAWNAAVIEPGNRMTSFKV